MTTLERGESYVIYYKGRPIAVTTVGAPAAGYTYTPCSAKMRIGRQEMARLAGKNQLFTACQTSGGTYKQFGVRAHEVYSYLLRDCHCEWLPPSTMELLWREL